MADKDLTLPILRDEIDSIDDQILELLNKRAGFVLEVGRIKEKDGKKLFHVPEREEAIYKRLTEKNTGPFPENAIRPVYREIISASLAMEKALKIACLGPEATFCHVASIEHFGQAANFIPTRDVPDIFDEVERGRADYGVVPIENSTEGVVNLTLDMFFDSPLQICAEVMLSISQCLLSTADNLEDIKVIYSHPQAIAQCYTWISRNLPHVEIKETLSTALAAKTAKEQKGTAAIASEFAAKTHRIPVFKAKIEDNPHNYTRFWVIGKKSPGASGKDKTSLMYSIRDGVGALHNLLMPFYENGINLTKIESRPFRKKPWEYIFFIDIEGHMDDSVVKKAINSLASHAQFMKVLGSYPRSVTPV
jgi:chorismate mutase/prephenate dehydratase